MRVHVRTRNRMHQSAIVLVRCVSPSAAILEKTLGTRFGQYKVQTADRVQIAD